MLSWLWKMFNLLLLFFGGYALMRWGMDWDPKVALLIAFVAMPLATFILWYISYRGKRFG